MATYDPPLDVTLVAKLGATIQKLSDSSVGFASGDATFHMAGRRIEFRLIVEAFTPRFEIELIGQPIRNFSGKVYMTPGNMEDLDRETVEALKSIGWHLSEDKKQITFTSSSPQMPNLLETLINKAKQLTGILNTIDEEREQAKATFNASVRKAIKPA